MFDNPSKGASDQLNTYKLELLFRPGGKIDVGYISGFADCLGGMLKINCGAIGRQFGKLPQGILLTVVMDSDHDTGEAEVAQFIVDLIEKSSLPFEQVDLAIDGRKLNLVHEK